MIPLDSKFLCLSETDCQAHGYTTVDKNGNNRCNACPDSMNCDDCVACNKDDDANCKNGAYCTKCAGDYK